jgi:hypothetical protein
MCPLFTIVLLVIVPMAIGPVSTCGVVSAIMLSVLCNGYSGSGPVHCYSGSRPVHCFSGSRPVCWHYGSHPVYLLEV